MAEAALALREEIVEEITHVTRTSTSKIDVPVFDSLDPKTQVFALVYVLRHLSIRPAVARALSPGTRGRPGHVREGRARDGHGDRPGGADAEDDTKFLFRRLIRDALEGGRSVGQARPSAAATSTPGTGTSTRSPSTCSGTVTSWRKGPSPTSIPPWPNPSRSGPGSTTTTSPRRRPW